MNNVLVLGAGGMAGHIVALYLTEKGFDVDTLSAKNAFDGNTRLVNVHNLGKFKEALSVKQYDVIVNCIALLVKDSEEKKDEAIYINSYLPRFLEHYFKDGKTKVIHISTDAVFSFKNPPYQEDSFCDGESFYGRTKALGEIINSKDLTLRTSIVGPVMREGAAGLFNWFYSQKGEVPGYTDALWSGVTTIELAKGIKAAIDQGLSGLYHFVPKEGVSKFDLLTLFKESFNRKDINLKPVEGFVVNNVLKNTRHDFDYKVSDYKTMINEMRAWIKNHPEFYGHYEK